LTDRRLLGAVDRSLVASSIVAVLATTLCLGALYRFPDLPVGRRRVLIAAGLIPLFVPEATHAISLWTFVNFLHMGRGTGALCLALTVYAIPFVMIIMLLQISRWPRSIYEASRDLGMNRITFARHVALPLLWPVCASSMVFSFLIAFNEYSRTSSLQGQEMYSVYLEGQLYGGGSEQIYSVSALTFAIGTVVLVVLGRLSARFGRPLVD